jgi:hypothetical protein
MGKIKIRIPILFIKLKKVKDILIKSNVWTCFYTFIYLVFESVVIITF